MQRLAVTAALACAGGLLMACATPQTDRAATVAALRAEPSVARSGDDAVKARASMAWGDRWTATNLFEQAAAGSNNVVNRFNLASGYQATGRTQEAAALYRGVVRDGQYTTVTLDPRYRLGERRARRVNLGDEAARRLAGLEGPAAMASAGPAPFSAAGAGVDVAAVEGVPAARRITDEEALALDTQAATARRP